MKNEKDKIKIGGKNGTEFSSGSMRKPTPPALVQAIWTPSSSLFCDVYTNDPNYDRRRVCTRVACSAYTPRSVCIICRLCFAWTVQSKVSCSYGLRRPSPPRIQQYSPSIIYRNIRLCIALECTRLAVIVNTNSIFVVITVIVTCV